MNKGFFPHKKTPCIWLGVLVSSIMKKWLYQALHNGCMSLVFMWHHLLSNLFIYTVPSILEDIIGAVVGGIGGVLLIAVFIVGFILGCLCCPCVAFCLLCRRKCCPCFSEKRICCGPYSEGKHHHVLVLLVIQLLRLHVGDSIPTPIVEKPPV